MVVAAATYRNLSKHSGSVKVIAVLETVKKIRALYSISEKAGTIIEFENLKARFGLNLYAKNYSDYKGVDVSNPPKILCKTPNKKMTRRLPHKGIKSLPFW